MKTTMKIPVFILSISFILFFLLFHPPCRVGNDNREYPLAEQPDLISALADTIPNIDITILTEKHQQQIDGFGACFNELGWLSLSKLEPSVREEIMEELFFPGVGANFTICRMPVGANDFSRDWYSYDEVDGDFTMEHFTIANDQQTLIPFIKNAQKYQPDLRLWLLRGALPLG